MNLGLEGTRVLVTAGASGIGLAVAREFAREGARVHVCDVDTGALTAISASDPALTHSVCDVSDETAVRRLFDATLTHHGGLDVLVNNAGIAGPTARCEDIELADWERTLAVNLAGQFLCAKLAIPHLRKSRNASIGSRLCNSTTISNASSTNPMAMDPRTTGDRHPRFGPSDMPYRRIGKPVAESTNPQTSNLPGFG